MHEIIKFEHNIHHLLNDTLSLDIRYTQQHPICLFHIYTLFFSCFAMSVSIDIYIFLKKNLSLAPAAKLSVPFEIGV